MFTHGNPKWNNKDIIFFFLRRIYEVMSFDGGTVLFSPSGCRSVKTLRYIRVWEQIVHSFHCKRADINLV